eukprot:928999-Prymnesium_polylepis.2
MRGGEGKSGACRAAILGWRAVDRPAIHDCSMRGRGRESQREGSHLQEAREACILLRARNADSRRRATRRACASHRAHLHRRGGGRYPTSLGGCTRAARRAPPTHQQRSDARAGGSAGLERSSVGAFGPAGLWQPVRD